MQPSGLVSILNPSSAGRALGLPKTKENPSSGKSLLKANSHSASESTMLRFASSQVGKLPTRPYGPIVGLAVGLNVGLTVGLSVGALVGLSVGMSVGARVGLSVGAFVGLSVGLSVGFSVGLSVGACEEQSER